MIASNFKQRAAEMSPTWARFLDFVEQHPESTKRVSKDGYHTDYAVQAWPTFISAQRGAEVARATTSVFKLLHTIPRKVFRDDTQRMTDYYRIEPARLAPWLLSEPRGLDIAVGRADFIDSEAGYKCVELNPFASLGGLETEFMFEIYRNTFAYSKFVADSGIAPRFHRCILRLFEHIIRVTRERGIARDVVNLAVVADGDLPAFSGCGDLPQAVYQEALANVGGGARGTLIRCGTRDIVERDGALCCNDEPLHAVWEYLRFKFYPARLVVAFKRGRIAYFNSPIAGHFGSKRSLALLSQGLEDGLYEGDEAEAIQRYIPWTREIAEREVWFGGARHRLLDLLRRRRDSFVLKKGQGYGGEQVLIGENSDAQQWEETLALALAEGDWIAQEFFEPRTFVYQSGEQGYAPCRAVWGGFCFGESFGGVYLRILPASVPGAINSARGAMTGFVFEV